MLSNWLKPGLNRMGFPVELLPMVLMRPLSGGGTLGMFTELTQHYGGDSLIARMAGTAIQASPSQLGERTRMLKLWRSEVLIPGGR